MPHSECFIDGVWFPSVTTIMASDEKPWLTAWRQKWGVLAERKMKVSGVIGTEFHRCVEAYLESLCFTINPVSHNMGKRIEGMMESFIRWAHSFDGEIHEIESKVISKQYAYSGTLDAVGMVDKKLVIWDWKTGSRIYDDYELQLAAYAQAYYEMTGKKIKEGIIVHISKDKPHFKLTTKVFKLGKRPLNRFLKLRANFDDVTRLEALNAKTIVTETTSGQGTEDPYQSEPQGC